ncbi:MAG TPA: Xaa-Pro peptidase family protein [Phycisphaerales bacterium]|nr:Xaa-Pro peptidase family protein [Phycisphaerales bacterium]
MRQPPITVAELVRRRERLLRALGRSVGVVFSGTGAPPLLGAWAADMNFVYLTGIADEAGAALLLDPTAEDPSRRLILFLRPLDPEQERWDGLRDPIDAGLKARTGFATVMRTGALPRMLTAAARRARRLACLHPLAVYDAAVSPDLAVFRKLAERVPGVNIQDASRLLPGLRALKSPRELELTERACAVTAAGYQRALADIHPGSSEDRVARTLREAFAGAPGGGLAYNPIVGSGLRSTILHYMANTEPLRAGELLLIDAGAMVDGYCCDVTRTYPVGGRFTSEQREVYEVVLRAQAAAIRAVRPGTPMHSVDAAARRVIVDAGFGDAFIHGIGHPLGLEVHDPVPDGPLKPGMIVTIEPGVYLPQRNLGVRIEDDLLVTRTGSRNLTVAIPKSVREVEAALAAAATERSGRGARVRAPRSPSRLRAARPRAGR